MLTEDGALMDARGEWGTHGYSQRLEDEEHTEGAKWEQNTGAHSGEEGLVQASKHSGLMDTQ